MTPSRAQPHAAHVPASRGSGRSLRAAAAVTGGAVLAMLWCAGTSRGEAAADYWPLEVGNQWLYEHAHHSPEEGVVLDTVLLQCVSKATIAGNEYFVLNTGSRLRTNEEGSILERRGEADVVIIDLSHLEDSQYRFFIPEGAFPFVGGCGSGYPATRSASRCSVSVGAERFACVWFGDGYLSEGATLSLVAGIGPVRMAFTTDIPPGWRDMYELIEYRLGGGAGPTSVRSTSWAEIKRCW